MADIAPNPVPPDRLRQVLDDLESIDGTPLAEQAAVYERMHAALVTALDATALDATALDATALDNAGADGNRAAGR